MGERKLNWTEWALRLHWNSISSEARRYGLDPLLVASMVQTESSGNPWATRFEKDYKWVYKTERFAEDLGITEITERAHQKTSWGMLQIMGGVARECGYKGPLPKLCLVKVGLSYGCLKLSLIHKKYDKISDVVAAYNAGIPRLNKDGIYANQNYVDKVLGYYTALTSKPIIDD